MNAKKDEPQQYPALDKSQPFSTVHSHPEAVYQQGHEIDGKLVPLYYMGDGRCLGANVDAKPPEEQNTFAVKARKAKAGEKVVSHAELAEIAYRARLSALSNLTDAQAVSVAEKLHKKLVKEQGESAPTFEAEKATRDQAVEFLARNTE